MSEQTSKFKFDFLAVGEAVIDFISSGAGGGLEGEKRFERYPGGQVANLAANMAYLGNRVAIGTCVGQDGFGKYIQNHIEKSGINTTNLQITPSAPTTLIAVTKTPGGTPEFIAYRGADSHLKLSKDLMSTAQNSRVVHTSAFALSKDPARSTIIKVIQAAKNAGGMVSLDPNYHPKIWPDRENFIDQIEEIFKLVHITKPSIDDCHRIFGEGLTPISYVKRFLVWGSKIVVLTMGHKGVLLGTQDQQFYEIIPEQIPVVDVTGAGDAFWSGLLTAQLAGLSPLEAARVGQVIAGIKIGGVGPITQPIHRDELFSQASKIQYKPVNNP